MKKTLPLLVLLALCFSAKAQEANDDFKMPKALIKIYPQAFFVSTFQVGIETFNPSFSRSFNLDLGLRTSGSITYENYSGGYGEIAYRKYFVPMKLTDKITRKYYMGVYYSVGFKAGYYKTEQQNYYNGGYNDYTEIKLWGFSPSFTIGLQKTIWQVLVLDMFIGGAVGIPAYTDGKVEVDYPSLFDPAYKGIYPKIGVKIGIGL